MFVCPFFLLLLLLLWMRLVMWTACISTLVVPFARKTHSVAVWIVFIRVLKVSCGSSILLLYPHNLHYKKNRFFLWFLLSSVTGHIFTDAYPLLLYSIFHPFNCSLFVVPHSYFSARFSDFHDFFRTNRNHWMLFFPFFISTNFYRSISCATTNEWIQ